MGDFCWIAKGDVQSAFRIAPIMFKHIRCLGIKFEGQYFVDITLPFGSAISCVIFEDIATSVHWIFEQLIGVHFVHYLDDYLWVHKHYVVCLSTCSAVKRISQDIGLPLVPAKLVGPAQSLKFLGLTIDTVRMVVAIPQDKIQKILEEIQEVLQCSKCKVKKVQSLAGYCNFITKAVLHGRPFFRKVYDMIVGMKPHWHVNNHPGSKERLTYAAACFISDYRGWTPIITPSTPMLHLFHQCSNYMVHLRMGSLVGAWHGPLTAGTHSSCTAIIFPLISSNFMQCW